MVNLYDLRIHDQAKVSKMSSFCTFFFLAVTIGSLAVITNNIRKLQKNLNEQSLKDFNQRSSVLI
jgi:hypothetical protein